MQGSRWVGQVGLEKLTTCLEIRHTVFIIGQDVPFDLEVDGLDHECIHLLAIANEKPVGTARLRHKHGRVAKVERVAVLDSHRGQGWGEDLMQAVHRSAHERGWTHLMLNAQEEVIGFYERLGYVGEGSLFMEANIPHLTMSLKLKD